jgi:hypothetical protein
MNWKHVGVIILDIVTVMFTVTAFIGTGIIIYLCPDGEFTPLCSQLIVVSSLCGIGAAMLLNLALFYTHEMMSEWGKPR